MIAEPTARRTGTVRGAGGPPGSSWTGSGSSTTSKVSFVLTPPRLHENRRSAASVDLPLTDLFPAVGRRARTVVPSDAGPGRPGAPATAGGPRRDPVDYDRRPGPDQPLVAVGPLAAGRLAHRVDGGRRDVAAGDPHGGQRAAAAGPGPVAAAHRAAALPGRRRRGGGRGRARRAAALPGRRAAPAQAPGLGGGGRGDRGGGAVPPGQGTRRRGGHRLGGRARAAARLPERSSRPRPTRAAGGWRCAVRAAGAAGHGARDAAAAGVLGAARRPALTAHAG